MQLIKMKIDFFIFFICYYATEANRNWAIVQPTAHRYKLTISSVITLREITRDIYGRD